MKVSEQIRSRLEEAIAAGELLPGDPIDEAALAKFMDAAPDAAPAAAEAPSAAHDRKIKMKGHQAQITFALPPALLNKVDHMAGSLSISRAALIK